MWEHLFLHLLVLNFAWSQFKLWSPSFDIILKPSSFFLQFSRKWVRRFLASASVCSFSVLLIFVYISFVSLHLSYLTAGYLRCSLPPIAFDCAWRDPYNLSEHWFPVLPGPAPLESTLGKLTISSRPWMPLPFFSWLLPGSIPVSLLWYSFCSVFCLHHKPRCP